MTGSQFPKQISVIVVFDKTESFSRCYLLELWRIVTFLQILHASFPALFGVIFSRRWKNGTCKSYNGRQKAETLNLFV